MAHVNGLGDPPWAWCLLRLEIESWRRDLNELKVLLGLIQNLSRNVPDPGRILLLQHGWWVIDVWEYNLMYLEATIPEEFMLMSLEQAPWNKPASR